MDFRHLLFVMTLLISIFGLSNTSSNNYYKRDYSGNKQFPVPLRSYGINAPRRRTPGCRLGNNFYELEDKWHPYLPPRGQMYCMECECLPIIRKGRLHKRGRITCKNIADTCPKLNCSDGIRPVGQCCKVCPGSIALNVLRLTDNSDDSSQFLLKNNEPTRKNRWQSFRPSYSSNHREFTAFLTPLLRTNSKLLSSSKAVGRAHITLLKKSLHYTLYFKNLNQNSILRFFDNKGTMLFERNVYPGLDGKICGVWTSFPALFAKYIQTRRMFISIATPKFPSGELTGQIVSSLLHSNDIDNSSPEIFSSLLSSKQNSIQTNVGAAIMTMSEPSKLNYYVVYDGAISQEASKIDIIVSFEDDSGYPHYHSQFKINTADKYFGGQVNLHRQLSSLLASGSLHLKIATSKYLMAGNITPKLTCSSFYAVLSGSNVLSEKKNPKTGAAGFALIQIRSNGDWRYRIKSIGLSSDIRSVTLNTKNNHQTPAIARFHRRRVSSRAHKRYFRGNLPAMTASELYLLYTNQLSVLIESQSYPQGEISGKLTHMTNHPFLDQFQYAPSLLAGSNFRPNSVRTDAGGFGWFHLDEKCKLHFDLFIEGLKFFKNAIKTKRSKNGILRILWSKHVASTQQSSRVLKRFRGSKLRGIMHNLPSSFTDSLNSGLVWAQIDSSAYPNGEMRTRLHIPNDCSIRRRQQMQRDKKVDSQEDYSEKRRKRRECVVNGNIIKSGNVIPSHLTNKKDSCSICVCDKGTIVCQPMQCPKPTGCLTPVTLPGECCPACLTQKELKESTHRRNISRKSTHSNSYKQSLANNACYFDGDQRYHSVNVPFHPYLHPHGFSTCAVCKCVSGLKRPKITCKALKCPPLNCPEQMAFRRNSRDCCKTCPSDVIKPPKATPDPRPSLFIQHSDKQNIGDEDFSNKSKKRLRQKDDPNLDDNHKKYLKEENEENVGLSLYDAQRLRYSDDENGGEHEELTNNIEETFNMKKTTLSLTTKKDNRNILSSCQFRDKLYSPGEKWFPILKSPFKVSKCVECTCKSNGKYICSNLKCPSITKCSKPVRTHDICCPLQCPKSPLQLLYPSKG